METAKRLVVMIEGGTKGAGVVFHVDNQRRAWIMTANHVVRPGGVELSTPITVRFFGIADDALATLRTEASSDDDLAILVAPVPEGLTFPLGFGVMPANRLTAGAQVRAIGFPDGRRWGETFEMSPVVEVGSRRVKVDDPRVKKGYSGGILVDPVAAGLVGLVLDTDGVTAEALLMDLSLRIIQQEFGLPATLGTAPFVPRQPDEPAAGTAWTNPNDRLVYRWIPKGSFLMGCESSRCEKNAQPLHPVTFNRGFWMGETEVTQQAYVRVTGRSNSSRFAGQQRPVETANWEDASAFCRLAGMRLPTEAEWEYAARAGTQGKERYGRRNLEEVAWFGSIRGTVEVGQLKPNAWGLYDVLGNVSEWTADWYDEKAYRQPSTSGNAGSGTYRVIRGGSWHDRDPVHVDVWTRRWSLPWNRHEEIGFRCAGELR